MSPSRGAFPAVNPTDHAPLVYVLDDDEALRDSLRWLLESAGYSVVTYSTAERLLLEFEPGAAAVPRFSTLVCRRCPASICSGS